MNRKRGHQERDAAHKSPLLLLREQYERTTAFKGMVSAKIACAAPYNFFLTRIHGIEATYSEELSLSFHELIDKSLGEVEHTIHFTFMVEVGWLLAQYAVVGVINPAMTILYDCEDPDLKSLPAHSRIKPIQIQVPDPYGHHHTKMSIFFYTDGSARIAVYTANLVESDWENRTQGIWISPNLRGGSTVNTGESVTYFKKDFLNYLRFYKLPDLQNWIQKLEKIDMSSIMVCFIPSCPGTHSNTNYGYLKVKAVLEENETVSRDDDWSIVAQCSSIGSLGSSATQWVLGSFAKALNRNRNINMHLIYPSLTNVKRSLDGMLGGACLPYNSVTHSRQIWLKDLMCQWKSYGRIRSKAIPHIKTYTKLSSDGTKAAWFLLTSANLSKAAWGGPSKNGLHIRSYEAGILFLPKFFTGEDSFKVKTTGQFEDNESFPFPYDTPLHAYQPNDQPFFYDKCFS